MTDGWFSVPVDAPPGNRVDQLACPLGSYCTVGVATVCPAGRYGNTTALVQPSCSGPCSPGYRCPTNSSSATALPCATDASAPCADNASATCSLPPRAVYCPLGSSVATLALPGEKTVGGCTDQTMTAVAACSEGHYCIGGVETPCPPGRFGCSDRLDSSDCNGLCAPGYYCPLGSTSNAACACGGNVTDGWPGSVYCPVGVGAPVVVAEGWYSTGSSAFEPQLRTSEAACPPGSYCVQGALVRGDLLL